ncbi:MAG TPA: acyltransferase family protein [Mycobacteriales bacterium]|nr:acyltransferase family protein [Mycobacteriales bacterium]
MTSSRLRYQPGLDGVRGLAVLAVLLYHARISWARGGFLGVDVFFVLSGFLITRLLLAEWRRWGSIDLRRFWLRRARRLLPALFLVLLAVALYASVLASAGQLATIRGDALATLGYVANWRFVFAEQSYFAQYDEPSPLRHMWSLGIEEQFYLLFPLLLIGLLALRARRPALATIFGLGALGSAALAAALYHPGADPSRVYYGTDTRLQALLIGAAAGALFRDRRAAAGAYLSIGGRDVPLPGRRSFGLLGLAGLLVLLGTARDTAGWLYRGGFLLVALVAVAVVVAAATTGSATARVLSVEPLRRLGLISYGLYLWHWPVYVVLTPSRAGFDGAGLVLLRLAVSVALATASYQLVERPVRAGALGRRWSPGRLRPAAAGSLVVVLAAVLAGTAGAGNAAGPGSTTAGAPPAQQRQPGDTAAYLVGDSVPFNLRTNFKPEYAPGLFVAGSTQLGCGLIPVPIALDGQPKALDPRCPPWSQAWPADADAVRPDIGVVFAGIGEQFDHVVDGQVLTFGTPAFEQHLDTELTKALGSLGLGRRPVAVVNVGCHQVLDTGLSGDAKVINDESRVRWLDQAIARYAAQQPGVSLIDLYGFLCADGYTNTRDGVQLRVDGLHFTPEGAAIVWRWLGPQLIDLAHGDLTTPTDPATPTTPATPTAPATETDPATPTGPATETGASSPPPTSPTGTDSAPAGPISPPPPTR